MDLNQVLDELKIEGAHEALQDGWEESQARALEGAPEFLAPDAVRAGIAAAHIPEQWHDALLRTAELVRGNEAASALAWHARYWLHEAQFSAPRVRLWPNLGESALGHDGALLWLIALISGYERMQEVHRQHDVPEEVVRDTLLQIDLYLRDTTREQGYPEVPPRLIAWLMNHYTGVIYRLARLQFQFGTNHYRIRVYRHRKTGRVSTVSEAGVRFRDDGQILRVSDDATDSWEAQLTLTDEAVRGTPISPEGRALRDHVELQLEEWEQELVPGDPVLHIHIPGGEPMDFDACGEAFRRALEFFPRHFPNYHFNAFMCGSWVLNTALQEIAPATSNMVLFQREVYLFPIGLGEDSLPSGLFGGLLRDMPEDLSQAPRATSLQRAYLDAMERGGLVTGGGGCFLLPEDVNWGAQVYLDQRRQPGSGVPPIS